MYERTVIIWVDSVSGGNAGSFGPVTTWILTGLHVNYCQNMKWGINGPVDVLWCGDEYNRSYSFDTGYVGDFRGVLSPSCQSLP